MVHEVPYQAFRVILSLPVFEILLQVMIFFIVQIVFQYWTEEYQQCIHNQSFSD